MTEATTSGHLTVHATSTVVPATSALNYRAGRTRANNALLALGSDGGVVVHCGQPSGTVHLLIDVAGYFE